MHCRFQSLTPCFADFQKAGITNLLNHPTSVSAISIPGSGIVWCSTTFFLFFLVIGLAEKLCSANRQEIYVHLWATELDANSQASHDRIPPPSASAPTGASSSTLAAILSCRSWHLRISHTMLNASSPERWRRAHLLGFAVLMVIGLPGSFDCEREFKARNLRQEQNDLPIHYEHTLPTAADGMELSLPLSRAPRSGH